MSIKISKRVATDRLPRGIVRNSSHSAANGRRPGAIEAVRKAKELGMMVCMGATNHFRDGSHCGNLSPIDAIAEGLLGLHHGFGVFKFDTAGAACSA